MGEHWQRVLLSVVCGLLGVPAFFLALFSVLVLDAPWSGRGVGIALAWLFILACCATAGSLAFSVAAVWRLGWPAALVPVPGLVIVEVAAHGMPNARYAPQAVVLYGADLVVWRFALERVIRNPYH